MCDALLIFGFVGDGKRSCIPLIELHYLSITLSLLAAFFSKTDFNILEFNEKWLFFFGVGGGGGVVRGVGGGAGGRGGGGEEAGVLYWPFAGIFFGVTFKTEFFLVVVGSGGVGWGWGLSKFS